MIAHMSGIPIEELLPGLAGGGWLLLVTRLSIALRDRRRRRP